MIDSQGKRPRTKQIALATTLVVAGLVLTLSGLYAGNQAIISADSEPPTPAEPSEISPPAPLDPATNPVSPDDPTQPAEFSFPAGWSMISGMQLRSRNLTELTNSGVLLYSFNDPYYPTTKWTIFPGLSKSGKTKIALKPVSPLGYYVYNPADAKTVTIAASTSPSGAKVFGRGWHLFSWGDQNSVTREELLAQIKITYSNDTVMTAAEAMSESNHRASVKIYVVTDEHDIEFDKSVKELTGVDSDTTISKLPKNGYYWVYFRRTKDRVSAYNDPTTALLNQTIDEEDGATPTPAVDNSQTSEDILPPVPQIPTSATAS